MERGGEGKEDEVVEGEISLAQRAFLGRTDLIKHQKDGGDVAEPRVSSEVP